MLPYVQECFVLARFKWWVSVRGYFFWNSKSYKPLSNVHAYISGCLLTHYSTTTLLLCTSNSTSIHPSIQYNNLDIYTRKLLPRMSIKLHMACWKGSSSCGGSDIGSLERDGAISLHRQHCFYKPQLRLQSWPEQSLVSICQYSFDASCLMQRFENLRY